LTLREVAGLTTGEIARAFLVAALEMNAGDRTFLEQRLTEAS
jgi:predicted RNA polymerase sigma factor